MEVFRVKNPDAFVDADIDINEVELVESSEDEESKTFV